MPVFRFEGTNRAGRKISGRRTAANRQALAAALFREQVRPLRIEEKSENSLLRSKVSSRELAIFFRQFSVMIDAGLPLVQCIDLIAGNQETASFAEVLHSVRGSVEGGSTLAHAMRQFPKVFDELTTNMVEAGEAGGILDTILQRMATYVEKAVKLKSAIKSALIYPTTVIGFAVLIVFFLLWKVVPVFTTLFASLNAQLPLPTRIVIGLSTFIGHFWWLFLSSPVILVILLRQYHQTPQGRMVLDGLLLRTWIIGPVLRKIAIARFSRTLGTLISSGVPILDGLAITARTSGNAVIEDGLMRVRRAIEEGRTMIDPLREAGIFPNMVVQMIGAGEQTGAMDAMLQKIADFYEHEVDTATRNMLTLLEPLMIGVLGFAVGGIVISMYLPLFSLLAQLSQNAH